jgi:hypothetical protein
LIILSQAIRHVIPPLVNTFIAFFKDDTSLVLIIGIFELLTTAKTAIIDPAWQSFSVEVYLFVGLIYFAFCFAMSRYSRSLEARAGPTRRAGAGAAAKGWYRRRFGCAQILCADPSDMYRAANPAGVAEYAQITLDLGRITGGLFRIV